MTRRHYVDNAPATTITGTIDNTATSFGVVNLVGFPTSRPYTGTLGRGTASAEQVIVTDVVGSTVTVTRNANGQGAFSHTVGEKFEHTANAVDFDEANAHVNATTDVHGVTGALVGTTNAQTLTNKTLAAAVVTATSVAGTPGITITTSDADTTTDFALKNHAGTTVVSILGSGATTVNGLTNTGNQSVTGNSTVSGNEAVTGTLTVTGVTTLNAATDVNGAFTATSMASDTSVAATTSLSGATMTTTGNATVGGNLSVNGSTTSATATTTGNSTVGGNLAVTGTTTLTGVLTSQNAIVRAVDVTGRPASPAGRQAIWRDDMGWIEVWDGTAWRVQGIGIVPTKADLAKITDPIDGQYAMVLGAIHPHRWIAGSNAWEKTAQSGTKSMSFTSLSSTTQTVTFPEAFVNIPSVNVNINSGSGSTSDWHARAINITTTSFGMFVYGAGTSTWSGVNVNWTATAS